MNKLKLFGKRIRELRKKSGFTQEQLSEKIGLYQKQIGNIETGNCFTTMQNLEKFSQVFDVEIKDLFDFDYKEEREVLVRKINTLIANSSDEELRKLYRIMCVVFKWLIKDICMLRFCLQFLNHFPNEAILLFFMTYYI